MDLTTYINDPSQLSEETLFRLRELVARYPYFQPARLLYMQNLFLVHNPTFGEQLRRNAILLPDRTPLFEMVEGANYAIDSRNMPISDTLEGAGPAVGEGGRTTSLIDNFLEMQSDAALHASHGDATTDYTSYLMQLEDAVVEEEKKEEEDSRLDAYINKGTQRLTLKEEPEYVPKLPIEETEEDDVGDDFLTETLAKIYIKQGRYEKASEILRRINFNYPKKNIYFADQIRFLEKLIVNERNKKSKK
ncbi:MAG: tetratricopeptide repeat protein [Alloprevotella sp.]|nr:tetratricopeptide repeat protein [Alloprevotella sp.]